MNKQATLTGWGNYPVAEGFVSRPENLRYFNDLPDKVIARGYGRSYGDAALNTERTTVLMERLNRFRHFDSKTGVLTAEAGVSIEEVLDVFVPRGWFVSVTPGTKYVTLGACVACDVHGKNHHHEGSFSNFVLGIELILADGSRRKCSPAENTELFWATVGGMGLTGIISEVTIQLQAISSAYMRVQHHSAKNLDSILHLLDTPEYDDRYSVAWIDCLAKGKELGKSVLMRGHHASASELDDIKGNLYAWKQPRRHSVPFQFPSWVLNPWTVQMFNKAYYAVQSRKTEPFTCDYDQFFYPLDSVGQWNRIYGKRGFLQYQFLFPDKTAREGLKLILEQLSKQRRASFLAVLKRFGPEGQGLLSFPSAGYTLALDIPFPSGELICFLHELDEIVLKHSGRIYLAKDSCMKAVTFRQMYPRYQEWLAIKDAVDPGRRFTSDLSRRLQIGGIDD
jgi:decaprenylphospho-beta-D-ribofuranose 2-oxidase